MIRSFIAIEMPADLRSRLEATIDELRNLRVDARLSRPESVHLTLKFLGDIRESQIQPIEDALTRSVEDRRPFPIRISGLGVFPYLANPRVVWVGIDGGKELIDLQHDVESSLSELAFPPEKRAYEPHLTLARVKSRRNIAALIHYVESSGSAVALGEFVARGLHLYQSILKPQGAEYRKLASLTFGQSA